MVSAKDSKKLPPAIHPLPPFVFDHLDKLGSPSHVYIIGGGPTGADAFGWIPEDGYTIAANSTLKACCDPNYYPWPWNIWSAFDVNGPLASDNYWKHPVPKETIVLMGKTLSKQYGKADYYFDHGQSMRPGRNPIALRLLQGGGTIIGCNIQLAWFLGAHKFTLVAVDMKGNLHWNGTIASRRTGNWPQGSRLSWLITALKRRGATFNTLTPTALKGIPLVKPGKERL